ncbi:MAG: host attachment protein [Planctomycetes bacterium]|nr:host attachment protein [Planctomycetota bacterium]
MNQDQDDSIWVGILDQRKGRIVRIRPVPEGRYRCEEHGSIESPWEEHEHGRPSSRSGKMGHSYASQGHEHEEMMRRFAREVAEWLNQSVQHLNIDVLNVFSPARFLGELRQTCPARLARRLEMREGDLTFLNDGDLVHHGAITPLIGAPKARN